MIVRARSKRKRPTSSIRAPPSGGPRRGRRLGTVDRRRSARRPRLDARPVARAGERGTCSWCVAVRVMPADVPTRRGTGRGATRRKVEPRRVAARVLLRARLVQARVRDGRFVTRASRPERAMTCTSPCWKRVFPGSRGMRALIRRKAACDQYGRSPLMATRSITRRFGEVVRHRIVLRGPVVPERDRVGFPPQPDLPLRLFRPVRAGR